MDNILSIFIDESGVFGDFSSKDPYYLVSMVLHDQRIDISEDVAILDRHIRELGFPPHAIHTGPLIRRESIYLRYDDMAKRASLINAMYHFTRKLNIHYISHFVRKSECKDYLDLNAKLSREISANLRRNMDYLNSFNRIILYYDNDICTQ